MVQPKPSEKRTSISGTIVGVLLLILFLIWANMYITRAKEEVDIMSKSAVAVADRVAAETNQRYRFINLGADTRPVLVLRPFEYTEKSGLWFLVSKSRGLGMDYVPKGLADSPVATYQKDTSIKIRKELVEPLRALNDAAQKDGVMLMIRSGYRSSIEQEQLQRMVLVSGGSDFVAPAGSSEHQTGLAVDFNDSSTCVSDCSLSSRSALWLEKHAANFGFILRYPEGKTNTTGYPPENWHYRYVGVRLAQAMQQSGKTFDEVYPLFVSARERTER